jgi:hypothetical protein
LITNRYKTKPHIGKFPGIELFNQISIDQRTLSNCDTRLELLERFCIKAFSCVENALRIFPMSKKISSQKWFKLSPIALSTMSLLLGSIAPFSLQSASVAQSTFSDTQGSWAQSCIAELSQRNIVSGYPDGSFRPNAPVNRAEFAAMVGKAFPNAARVRSNVQFVDVSSSEWFYNVVSTAYQTGFMSGYPGNVFNPSQSIPRAQVLVSLTSGLNYAPSQPVATSLGLYADASAIPGYAQNGIAAATERRLVVNYPDVRLLNPNQLASRAEVAAFLCQSLTGTGQLASVIPGQFVAGGGAVAEQRGQVLSGTNIPVRYTAAERIVVAPNETADVTLTVAADVRDSQGAVAIPAGSLVNGQLVPSNGGSQFVARSVVVNGQAYALSATSGVVQTKKNLRDPNIAQIIGGAALGSGAAAVIGGTTGNRTVNGGNVLLGGTVAAATAANQGRNALSAIRDAAIGAALGTGVAGLTGDRTITPKKVITGAATAATVGGIVDRGTVSEVVVINPDSDLTLTVNNNWSL